jgi:hypothetical protein
MLLQTLLTLVLITIPVQSHVPQNLMAKMEKGEAGGSGTLLKGNSRLLIKSLNNCYCILHFG